MVDLLEATTLKTLAFLAAGSLLSVSGCTTIYEGGYDFSQGWRRAQVVEITPGSSIRNPDFWKCLRNTSAAERQAQSYVVLSYREFGRKRQHLVPLPRDIALRADERVYLNVGECQGAIAKIRSQ